MARVKKKDHENLSAENIKKVIELLNPTEGKPITKKAACEVLNISYNTTRLGKIIEDFQEREIYVARRKSQNKGKRATDAEISETVTSYLQGDSVAEIAKALYRSSTFVKDILNRIGVPQRPSSAEAKMQVDIIPEECMSETFVPGEIVWSARYHRTAVVREELSIPYQSNKKGLGGTDYEKKYGSKCYQIYIIEKVDSEDSLFPGVETGGFSAYSLAYDMGKLEHLKNYGVDLSRI